MRPGISFAARGGSLEHQRNLQAWQAFLPVFSTRILGITRECRAHAIADRIQDGSDPISSALRLLVEVLELQLPVQFSESLKRTMVANGAKEVAQSIATGAALGAIASTTVSTIMDGDNYIFDNGENHGESTPWVVAAGAVVGAAYLANDFFVNFIGHSNDSRQTYCITTILLTVAAIRTEQTNTPSHDPDLDIFDDNSKMRLILDGLWGQAMEGAVEAWDPSGYLKMHQTRSWDSIYITLVTKNAPTDATSIVIPIRINENNAFVERVLENDISCINNYGYDESSQKMTLHWRPDRRTWRHDYGLRTYAIKKIRESAC